MVYVKLSITEQGTGAFKLYEAEWEAGEMVIGIVARELTVYHTQVAPEAEGKGYARQLFNTMVSYVRDHQLYVLPFCPYVLNQFKRHPDQYADIWKKQLLSPK